jgi:hypothetical protein
MSLPSQTKQDLVDEICKIANLGETFELFRGSSIPIQFFQKLERRFSIPIARGMEVKAETFCIYFGVPWTSDCDSSSSPSGGGGTVTKVGLLRLKQAVKIGLEREISD